MANKPDIALIGGLDEVASEQQIKKDVKKLNNIFVPLKAKLDFSEVWKQLNKTKFTIPIYFKGKDFQIETKRNLQNAQKIADRNKVKVSYSFEMDKNKFQNQLINFSKENSKLFTSKEMTQKYNQLVDSAYIAKSSSELKGLRKQLSAFRTELIAVNKAGMTWTDKFKVSISHFAQYFSGASFIYTVANQLRNAWTEAKTLDDRLVDLQKVTSEIENRDSLYKYFDKALKKANELNVEVGSLIYAITEFKKLGWSLSDAELGGEWATKLSNVGDIDIDTAIGSIKTSIASFDEIGGYRNDQMDKKLEAYADLINNMSNKYSIDAEGLAEAIRLSAGTLTEANTTIEQAATMFATANKYYNDPKYLGNTAKVGSLRLRATTGDEDAIKELSEMGEDIEEVTALTGKLRKELLKLTGVDIMVDNNTFKSYYDQLYEISQVIDELDDTTSAKVLEMLFGKNRAAAGESLLSGMQESEKAYADAINSAGSATAEYEVWMQSAEAATQKFSNSLTEMYQSIINGNTVRDLANIGSSVVDFANKWGILEGAVKGYLALKVGTAITSGAMAFVSATKQLEQYGKALQMVNNIPNGNFAEKYSVLRNIAQATSILTDKQLKQVLASEKLSYQDRIRILQIQGMNKEIALQKLAEMKLTQVTNAQTLANKAQTVSTFNLKSAMIGLKSTIQGVFLSNPVGITLMGLSVGFSALTSVISNHNQKLEETKQKNLEASEKAVEQANSLKDLCAEYSRLSSIQERTASQEEEFKAVVEDITKKLGDKAKVLEGLTAGTNEYAEALANVTKEELQSAAVEATVGRKTVEEDLQKNIWNDLKGSKVTVDSNSKGKALSDEAQKAVDIVSDSLKEFETINRTWNNLSWDVTSDSPEEVLEYYNALVKAREKLVLASENDEALLETEVYKDLNSAITTMSDSLEDYINKRYEEEKLNYMAQNGIPQTVEEYEVMKKAIDETAGASEGLKSRFNELLTADFSGLANSINEIVETAGDINVDESKDLWGISETISNLDTAKEKLSVLDETFSKLFDGDKKTNIGFEDFANINEAFSDVSGIENYISRLQEAGNNTEKVTAVMQDLIGAYLEQSHILDNVTEDNKDLIITMLEEVGIANAEQIVLAQLSHETEILALQKQFATETGHDLKEATIQEINEFLNMSEASEIAKQSIAQLTLESMDFANMDLSTDSKIEELINLANAAGASATAIAKAKQAMNLVNSFDSGDFKVNGVGDLKKLEYAQQTYDSIINKMYDWDYEPLNANDFKITNSSKYKPTYSPQKFVGTSTADAIEKANKEMEKSKKTIDLFEIHIDKINDAINLLKTNLDNVQGAFAKNSLINAEIGLNNEKMKNYSDALVMYTEKANQALVGIPSDIAEKIKNGAVSIIDYMDDSNGSISEAISEYTKWNDKISECKSSIAELHQELENLEKIKFENIAEDFTNQFDILETGKDWADKQMSLFEEMGLFIGESFYLSGIEQTKKQLVLLEEEKKQLLKQLESAISSGRVEKGSEAWLSMIDTIGKLQSQIISCKENVEEFSNELLALNDKVFEEITDRFDSLHSELENLEGLFKDFDVSDGAGNWSKEGLARLGLLAQNLELSLHEVQKYNEQIELLNQNYAEGKYSALEYAEKLSTLKSSQMDCVNSSEAIKDAIVELNSKLVEESIEAIEKETDAFRKNIEAQIESIEKTEELIQKRKELEGKTKTVSDLEKALAAVMNDDSAAGIARRKKLEDEIRTAKEELAELERQNSVESQKDALNQSLKDYEASQDAEIEKLRQSLEDKESLIFASLEAVKQNSFIIGEEIKNMAEYHGIAISDAIITSWQNGENAIASYGSVLSAGSSAFIGNIMGVENEVYQLQYQANATADSLAWMFATRADNLVGQLTASYTNEQMLNYMTQALRDSLVNTLERGYDISGITGALNSITSGLSSVADQASRTAQAIRDAVGAQNELSQSSGKTVTVVGSYKTQKYDKDTGKLLETKNYPRYASGTRSAKSGIAITDEEGYELKMPKLANGNYSVLPEGSQVLTKKQTDMIYEWAKLNPDTFIPTGVRNMVHDLTYNQPQIVNRNVSSPTLEFNGNLVNVEKLDQTNIGQVKELVQYGINNLKKQMYEGKKYGNYNPRIDWGKYS